MEPLQGNCFRLCYRPGVLTKQPETLSNDFFVNLFDMNYTWTKTGWGVYEAGPWKASEVDLVFGSNAELRAIGEFYACEDGNEQFVRDFADAWAKVMDNDRI